ncbi:glycoside hydrolase family 3 N-terminal domain-containing protein [Terrihabitans sp. B22-R8]|uniref:glycoside hydrolase family 3 N-terminal domain-containing protein n=1 Tax=Terrihabitans sp. B22-R8 TaxID=3425128 RepID=UPI00403CE9DA
MPSSLLRLTLLALVLFAPIAARAQANAPDPAIEARIDGLLSRMTLEEKVGQLIITGVDQADAPEIVARGGAGATIGFNTAEITADIQKVARGSRLGIPLLTGLDVVHGFRTLFPMPLAQAASFNPDLARNIAELSAREAMAAGVNWTFSPMIDMGRDVRWGRIVEGAGEDVFLARAFAAAQVEGFRAAGMATTLKHFVGYGAVAGGRDYDGASVPANELADYHYPPFQAGIAAGAESVMSALSALNGLPSTADRSRLTGVLKDKWGFGGFVVSDWSSIGDLIRMGVAADGAEAARKAMLAGVDMDMMSGYYAAHLADEVRAERIPVSRVDEAVRRVLRVKFRTGLFERADPDPAKADDAALTPQLRQAARIAARDSMVLLRNENDVLPLKDDVKKIAVIGYLAEDAGEQLGPHEARGRADQAVSPLAGLREQAQKQGAELSFAQGCDRACTDNAGFPDAVATARASDVVIAVLGEPREFSGEAATRSRLGLWGRQGELLDALIATGKPVVLVVMAGRPLDISPYVERLASVLMAWYPGTEGGHAVADLVFGVASPSARLPLTWPRNAGQAPMFYDALASGRPYEAHSRFTLKYIDEKPGPLFPFGFGLTYTAFAYSDVRVDTASLGSEGTLAVSVTLRNEGEREGSEIAQLYVRDELASQTRPGSQLKAFERVTLKPGEERRVVLKVPAAELGFTLEDGSYVVEPGRFLVGVGGDATVELAHSFEVTDGLRRAP